MSIEYLQKLESARILAFHGETLKRLKFAFD